VIEAIATAAIGLSDLIADGPLAGITGRTRGVNSDGDHQKDIDLAADAMMRAALRATPVAPSCPRSWICLKCSMPRPRSASPSIRSTDRPTCETTSRSEPSFRSFARQRHHLHLLRAWHGAVCRGLRGLRPSDHAGAGVRRACRHLHSGPAYREFLLIARRVRIAPNTPEFAINASNQRHWHGPVRAYIDDCLAGTSGNGSADFNMRWIGSLVAESLRILVRGGVFLYPADARPGYRDGRLRLLYEAHPMALVMEWAGGAATTGRRRILELSAKTQHQRVPLIMGSMRGVRDVAAIMKVSNRCSTIATRRCSRGAACFARSGKSRCRAAIPSSRLPDHPAPARPR
jgi:fructose-1,6-bisphosphatase I